MENNYFLSNLDFFDFGYLESFYLRLFNYFPDTEKKFLNYYNQSVSGIAHISDYNLRQWQNTVAEGFLLRSARQYNFDLTVKGAN